MTAELTVVHFYRLRDAGAFDRAARLLLARLRLTGMEGLRSYRFLGSARDRRLVAVHVDAQAWVAHRDLIDPWPEARALRDAARVVRTDLYGTVPAPLWDWVRETSRGQLLFHEGRQVQPVPEDPQRPRPRSIWLRGSGWRQAG